MGDRGDTFGDELNHALKVLDLDIDTANLGFQLVEPLRGLLSKRTNLLIRPVYTLIRPVYTLIRPVYMLIRSVYTLIRPVDSLPQFIEPLCVLRAKGLEEF